MTTYVDLEPCTYFGPQAVSVLRAVGWLEAAGFPAGDTDRAVYKRLVELLSDPFQPVAVAGPHECTLCQFDGPRGAKNLFVPNDNVVYVCPELIGHYINAHSYRPPDEFCAAVLKCPDTATPEYRRMLLAAGGRVLLRGAG
jgi:hypothetical protein